MSTVSAGTAQGTIQGTAQGIRQGTPAGTAVDAPLLDVRGLKVHFPVGGGLLGRAKA